MKVVNGCIVSTVGFTCSCFDLLHAGHILMLQDCKSVCDYLIVAVQSDPTINRNNKNKLTAKISSVTKDSSGNIIGYLFDLFYNAKDGSSLSFEIEEKIDFTVSARDPLKYTFEPW